MGFATRNVLAHVRASVRQSLSGERLLYLDEIQSDWHAHNVRTSRDPSGTRPVVSAPFAKEWSLVALKTGRAPPVRAAFEVPIAVPAVGAVSCVVLLVADTIARIQL